MFVHAESPSSILPEELDTYLASGWFRMGQTIFTTQFLCFKNQLYNAVWLRVDLSQWGDDSLLHTLTKKNKHFRTEIRKATYSAQHQQLFLEYKKGVPFEGSSSLHQLLFGDSQHSIYDTYEVNIYDGIKLIACGVFDLGNESAQGISCFYNHDYKKYSLGKYLIYLKMQYCKNLGMKFFYPGYFVPGYKSFDYKLEIGKSSLHYWSFAQADWKAIKDIQNEVQPLEQMNRKLMELKALFEEDGRTCYLLRYEFFDANLVPHLQGSQLFDYPLFLYPYDVTEDSIYPLVVYNVIAGVYQLLQMRSVWFSNSPPNDTAVYSSHVLKADRIIFETENVLQLVQFFRKFYAFKQSVLNEK